MQRLKGKTAMVVGAGSIGPGWGNGKATAVTFAREGAQVLCVDRNGAAAEETTGIIKSEGGKATAFTADVSRAAGEWRLCTDGKCRTLSEIFGFRIGSNVTTMSACYP